MALLEIKNLQKKFGDLQVLKDINVSIEEGEVLVLIGPSGSGKSTFLRCLNWKRLQVELLNMMDKISWKRNLIE